MAAQKKRTSNFSSDEKRILTELVLKYQDVVENKRTDAATNSSKLKGWIRLQEEFNTVSTYCHRTHSVLKCCWENIKRQTKKDRADRKKQIFMTGGGKPPTPPPSNKESAIVEAILGPALKGISSEFDSDSPIFSETIEWKTATDLGQTEEVYTVADTDYTGISIEDNENIENVVSAVDEQHMVVAQNADTSNVKGFLKEKNDNDTWTSWTPKNLKTPVTTQLKVPSQNQENWLKRRRPKTDCLGDELIKEKIELVKNLKENAEKESRIRLAILDEQLKQEQIKTQKLMNA